MIESVLFFKVCFLVFKFEDYCVAELGGPY